MARFLALDWDHQQLLVVAATIIGGSVRIQKAVAWQEQQSPNFIEAEAQGRLLKERLKSARIAPAPVLACIGRDRVILKEVRYPAVPAHEEPAIVRFQAAKELTDPAEEVVIDYAPIGEPGALGDRRAQVMAVRREMLTAYQILCKSAGLKLAALTPRPYAAAVCLKRLVGTTVLMPPPEPPDAAVALLTATERWAEFSIMRGESLLLARSLAAGPGLAGEVRRNLMVHAGQSPQFPVKAAYVAGSAEQGALRQRLQELLSLPVHFFDPFAGAEGPHLPASNRGVFAGAVGLLHAQTERRALPINFAKPKEPKPPRDPNKKRLAIAAAAAAVLLVGAAGFCYTKLAEKDREFATLFLEKGNLDRELVQLEEDAKRIKALDDVRQTSVVLLDEFYDLTDRFPEPNNIRLVQFLADPIQRTAKDKDKHVARITLKGLTTDDYKDVTTLISRLVEDGHYRVDPKQLQRNQSGLERFRFGTQFTTKVDVEKQPPSGFTRRLTAAPPEETDRRRGPGRRGAPGGGGLGLGLGFEGGLP